MKPVFVEKAGSMIEGTGTEDIGRALGHLNLFILAVMVQALPVNSQSVITKPGKSV